MIGKTQIYSSDFLNFSSLMLTAVRFLVVLTGKAPGMNLVQIVPFLISTFMAKGHTMQCMEGINAKQVNRCEWKYRSTQKKLCEFLNLMSTSICIR